MTPRVFAALECGDCGTLKVKALPADEPVREVLAKLACERCGSPVTLTKADVDVERRVHRLSKQREYQRRHADRIRARQRSDYQRPEVRARVRAYQRSPAMVEWRRRYYADPAVKARRAAQRRARRIAKKEGK